MSSSALGLSGLADLSEDGRFVLFLSTASDLITNHAHLASMDLFLRDRQTGNTKLISVSTNGTGGNANSAAGRITSSGQFVVFESRASNLVPNDTNDAADIFIRDLHSGKTSLVSASPVGGVFPRGAFGFDMSMDAHFVLFSAETEVGASLVQAVYLRDTLLGETRQVSLDAASDATTTSEPSLSGDGRYAAFLSKSQTPGKYGIFVRDLVADRLFTISTNSGTFVPSSLQLSKNGQFVFYGLATSLIATQASLLRAEFRSGIQEIVLNVSSGITPAYSIDENGLRLAYELGDIYLWDSVTRTNSLVSADVGGNGSAQRFCRAPIISRDGRFVAFMSDSTQLVTNVTNGEQQWFFRDLQNKQTQLITTNFRGEGAHGDGLEASFLALSRDGSVVAFTSSADDLVANDFNLTYDVFVTEAGTNRVELISTPAVNVRPSPGPVSELMSMSETGNRILIRSYQDGLFAPDTNGWADLYVHELNTGSNILVSVNTDGGHSGNGPAQAGVISGNGRYVAFWSLASDLAAIDTNRLGDVFLRDLQTGTTILVSSNEPGGTLNGDADTASISADGTMVSWRRGGAAQFLRDFSNNATTRIGNNSGSGTLGPVVSPDGKWVAFKELGSSYVLPTRGGPSFPLATNDANYARDPVNPLSFSPDSRYVFYGQQSKTNSAKIFYFAFDLETQTKRFVCEDCAGVVSSRGAESIVYMTRRVFVGDLQQIVLLDFATMQTNLISARALDGKPGNGRSHHPSISADGRLIVYQSKASDLVEDDSNNCEDVFIYNRTSRKNRLLSVRRDGSGPADGPSGHPLVSNDGTVIVFDTFASDLASPDVAGRNVVVLRTETSGDLRLTAMLILGSQTVQLSWPSILGRTYRVEFSADISPGNWERLQEFSATSDSTAARDSLSGNQARFYRVILLPIPP